jgi:hypothetical protein
MRIPETSVNTAYVSTVPLPRRNICIKAYEVWIIGNVVRDGTKYN